MSAPPMAPQQFKDLRAELIGQSWPVLAERRLALSALTDDWLRALYEDSAAPQGVALVGIGGYGRRELSPGSDLDLLLLHRPEVAVESVAERIWYPIWDSGIRLDHSTRTPSGARTLANRELKVMLGLLDARTVAGDPALLDGLLTSALADWRSRAHVRLEELRDWAAVRRRNFGDLAYVQQPDLKESLGGLRDVVVMRAVAASWITDVPRTLIDRPYQFLLDVRDALHTVSGRSSDKLVRQDQPEVAAVVGVPDPQGDGDGLLRAVASAGRTIDYARDLMWHRVDRLTRPSRRPGGRRSARTAPQRSPLTDGAVIADGEVVLARSAKPTSDPGLTLRLAAAAARAGLRISPSTLQRLATSAPGLPEPWPDPVRNDFVRLIGSGPGLLPVWEALDQENIISRLLPEWEVTRSSPQHNPVHLYTVDRHMVQTAVHAAALARETSRPDLLLTAALLHDIGKPQGRAAHAETGAQIVEELLPRMGFSSEDTAMVVSLVRNHLLLAEVATKRDTSDPDTIARVAAQISGPEELELLWALARADAEATGPAAATPWRLALIDGLVEQVAGLFTGRPDIALPQVTEAEQVAWDATDVVVLADDRSGLVELVIGAPTPAVAGIAGVLAMHRLDVIEARVRATERRAVTTWRVLPDFSGMPETHRLAVDVRRLLEGPTPSRAPQQPASRPQGAVPAARATVIPGASRSATVVELRAADSPGLLFALLKAVESTGAQVRGAKVATLGADVVDVFYLVDDAGEPLRAALVENVRSALLAAVTG